MFYFVMFVLSSEKRVYGTVMMPTSPTAKTSYKLESEYNAKLAFLTLFHTENCYSKTLKLFNA